MVLTDINTSKGEWGQNIISHQKEGNKAESGMMVTGVFESICQGVGLGYVRVCILCSLITVLDQHESHIIYCYRPFSWGM